MLVTGRAIPESPTFHPPLPVVPSVEVHRSPTLRSVTASTSEKVAGNIEGMCTQHLRIRSQPSRLDQETFVYIQRSQVFLHGPQNQSHSLCQIRGPRGPKGLVVRVQEHQLATFGAEPGGPPDEPVDAESPSLHDG